MSYSIRFLLRTLRLTATAFALTAAASPANAAASSTGVAAIVNEAVISNYDLDQRTALFVATSGISATPENLPQIRAQVLRSLEDEVIQLQEAGKRRISASRAEIEKAVQNIAEDNKLSTAQLMSTIERAGVSATTFLRQISAQIIWQKLVSARYGTEIIVSEQQVDEAMNRLRQGADKPQFLLSEIYIAVDQPENETSIRASVEQIARQIMMGASFATVAAQFSQSPSAADSGDIGWVLQGQLAEDLDHALIDMRPGQITPPIRAEGGYYVLLLRDRREPVGAKVVETSTFAPDPNAAVPLDRLLIPLPGNIDATRKNRAMTVANNVKNTVKSCADLQNAASQMQGAVYARLGNMSPRDLDPGLRAALGKTGPGEVIPPFFSEAGLELIMRCDARSSSPVAFALPTRNQLQQQLFMQQMSIFAQSYLRDLRRDAVVYAPGR